MFLGPFVFFERGKRCEFSSHCASRSVGRRLIQRVGRLSRQDVRTLIRRSYVSVHIGAQVSLVFLSLSRDRRSQPLPRRIGIPLRPTRRLIGCVRAILRELGGAACQVVADRGGPVDDR